MVVTADPLGDFNATSQILRYSALAREVTVPRVPSVTESILSTASSNHRSVSGRTSPNYASTEDLERAAAEITRLTKDCHGLAVRLAEEEITRSEVELRLRAAEERCLLIEQEVREECWAEMDEKMEEERRRWQNAWDEQVSIVSEIITTLQMLRKPRRAAMLSIWTRRSNWFPVVLTVSQCRYAFIDGTNHYHQYTKTPKQPQTRGWKNSSTRMSSSAAVLPLSNAI